MVPRFSIQLPMHVVQHLHDVPKGLPAAVGSADPDVGHPAGGQLGGHAAGTHQRHVGEPTQGLMQSAARLGGQVQEMAMGVDDDCFQQDPFSGKRRRHAGKDTSPIFLPGRITKPDSGKIYSKLKE